MRKALLLILVIAIVAVAIFGVAFAAKGGQGKQCDHANPNSKGCKSTCSVPTDVPEPIRGGLCMVIAALGG